MDTLSDLEITACTLIGEAESLGEQGMKDTCCTLLNRAAANLAWMGGSNVRDVCLQKDQYSCWNAGDNADRQRILDIAKNTPTYGPYLTALQIAESAFAGQLTDSTNGAVSYYDSDQCDMPHWARGKEPCYTSGTRFYFDLEAVT